MREAEIEQEECRARSEREKRERETEEKRREREALQSQIEREKEVERERRQRAHQEFRVLLELMSKDVQVRSSSPLLLPLPFALSNPPLLSFSPTLFYASPYPLPPSPCPPKYLFPPFCLP